MKKLSIVVSVYNEAQVIELFYQELSRVLRELDCATETIYVNDGSTDGSFEKLELLTVLDKNVKLVSFARNYGHEAAMIAGIDYSTGDGIICMDADLQHPVDLIPVIVEKFNAGYDIITMKRMQNVGNSFLKKLTSEGFYKVQNFISEEHFEENVSDFFAIAKKPAHVLKTQYREKVRFLRGYVQNLGYKKTSISYEAKERAAGKSKYSIKKLLDFSVNALLNFSNKPLKIAGYCGIFSALAGIILMIYTIYSRFAKGTPTGYATIIVALCFMFSILFLLLGVMGEYIGIIFQEVKNRPLYLVECTRNIPDNEVAEKSEGVNTNDI